MAMVLVMPACGRTVICLCRAPLLSFHCMILASEGHHIFQLRGAGATELRHSRKICVWCVGGREVEEAVGPGVSEWVSGCVGKGVVGVGGSDGVGCA